MLRETEAVVLSTIVGPTLHILLFIRGEWHFQAATILGGWLVVLAAASLGNLAVYEEDYQWIATACQRVIILLLATTCSTLVSILTYRIFFHPLSRFPGPCCARATQFWRLWKCFQSPQYLVLDKLYHEYGDFVRTGPRELMIINPDIYWHLDGPRSSCTKSDFYDLLVPSRAIIATREPTAHDDRRRLWSKAMNASNRRQYSERIKGHVEMLDKLFHEAATSDCPVLVNQVFAWFAFDTMGLFAFGRSFDMLESREYHSIALQLHRGLTALGVFSCMPWLARVGFAFTPGLWILKDWFAMKSFCEQKMEERVEANIESMDVASHLIGAAKKNGLTKKDHQWLSGDGIALIVGGSDTTSGTLTFLFYELARHPSIADQLYQELVEADADDVETLRSLPLLNGIISETLRLHPLFPSAIYRDTPAGGMIVDNTYIPGNTKILAPRWTISRLETCFEEADRWIPERWTSRPEMVRQSHAHSAFGSGRWSCVGKNLASDSIAIVVSRLVRKFQFSLREKRQALEIQDCVIAIPGNIELCIKLRA